MSFCSSRLLFSWRTCCGLLLSNDNVVLVLRSCSAPVDGLSFHESGEEGAGGKQLTFTFIFNIPSLSPSHVASLSVMCTCVIKTSSYVAHKCVSLAIYLQVNRCICQDMLAYSTDIYLKNSPATSAESHSQISSPE